MEQFSILAADLAEAPPSAHEIEAAGQATFDFGRALDVEPAAQVPVASVTDMIDTGEYTAASDALEGPTRQPFGQWLLRQKDRKDWIGDLAKGAKLDPDFPKRGTVEEVRERLEQMRAEGNAFEALDDAELDWLAR